MCASFQKYMGINFGGVLVWSLVVLQVVVEAMVEVVVVVVEVILVRIGGAMPMKNNSIPNKNSNKKKGWTIEQETLI